MMGSGVFQALSMGASWHLTKATLLIFSMWPSRLLQRMLMKTSKFATCVWLLGSITDMGYVPHQQKLQDQRGL